MKTHLVVKEFDEIISKDKEQSWMTCKTLPTRTFNDLKVFIEEFNTKESDTDALELMRIGYKRDYGDVITVKNYVGLIQMKDGSQIEVLPKVTFDADGDNKVTKRIFLKMIRSLKEFSGKVFNSSSLNTDRMNLYEIFINMYIQEARYLVKKGIKSFYETKEDNLKVYKGKLKIKDHIKTNTVHKERFFVEYDEYTTNRPENRLIKSTLLKLQNISTYIDNVREISNLLSSFELIDSSENYDSDFSKVTINRGNKEYETLMNWSKIFLYDNSFTTFSGSTVARAILFPMEKVFESYIAAEIKKALIDKDWRVTTQSTGLYLFDDPAKFSLRPDIVIKRNDQSTIVLDTKWKALISDERKNYGVSQADMYQMYAYAKKFDAKEIFVIYPSNPEMDRYKDNGITFISDDNVKVHLYFVDLINAEESIENLTIRFYINRCNI